jgi:hypothetical protein
VLPMQPGPAQDASESVGYEVGERTLHQLLRSWSRRSSASLCCPRSAPTRLSTATARRCTGADPWTPPAICTAPLVRAKIRRLGEGVSETDGRELASAVRGKHDAAVETLLRVNMTDENAAPMAAFTAEGDAGDRLDALE